MNLCSLTCLCLLDIKCSVKLKQIKSLAALADIVEVISNWIVSINNTIVTSAIYMLYIGRHIVVMQFFL